MESPYHAGELFVQQKAGEEKMAASNGRVIANRIPAGALAFVNKQPMVVISSLDKHKAVWVSVLTGKPGFIGTVDGTEIILSNSLLVSSAQDIFFENIKENKSVGLVLIELATRRRLRVNGQVTEANDQLTIEVTQAYPNCPKYIQRREMEAGPGLGNENYFIKKGTALPEDLKHWILAADTLFVGSTNTQDEMDVSHRGGNKGFIEIVDERTIKVPDYAGNSMFNTLGNFVMNPKAGVLFIDFEKGRTLQVSGVAEIIWQADDADHSGGTGRSWLLHINQWIITNTLSNTAWTFLDYSPFNPS